MKSKKKIKELFFKSGNIAYGKVRSVRFKKVIRKKDKAGRYYYLELTREEPEKYKRVSKDIYLENSYKKSFGVNWKKKKSEHDKGIKELKREYKKNERERKKEAERQKKLRYVNEVFELKNLSVFDYTDDYISNEGGFKIKYKGRFKKVNKSNYVSFKSMIQDFLGDFFRNAEKNKAESQPYFFAVTKVYDGEDMVDYYLDFDETESQNTELIDWVNLGLSKKSKLKIFSINKYLKDYLG